MKVLITVVLRHGTRCE